MRKKDKKKKNEQKLQNPNSDTSHDNSSRFRNVELKSNVKFKDIIILGVGGNKYNCALLCKKDKKQICTCSHPQQIDAKLLADIICTFMHRNGKPVTVNTDFTSRIIASANAAQHSNNKGLLSCRDALKILKYSKIRCSYSSEPTLTITALFLNTSCG